MFSLTKQVFIVLLSLSESLARDLTKCLFFNDEPCMVISTPVDMNPFDSLWILSIWILSILSIHD